MTNPAYPLLNGKRLSWASLAVYDGTDETAATPMKGFTKCSFKVMVERGVARGHGRHPLGHTEGDVSYEGSISFLMEEAETWLDGKGDYPLDRGGVLVLSYKAQGSTEVHKIELFYTGLKEWGGDDAQGPAPLERTFPLDVILIKRDGQDLTRPEG